MGNYSASIVLLKSVLQYGVEHLPRSTLLLQAVVARIIVISKESGKHCIYKISKDLMSGSVNSFLLSFANLQISYDQTLVYRWDSLNR